jgi:ribosomal protein S26
MQRSSVRQHVQAAIIADLERPGVRLEFEVPLVRNRWCVLVSVLVVLVRSRCQRSLRPCLSGCDEHFKYAVANLPLARLGSLINLGPDAVRRQAGS